MFSRWSLILEHAYVYVDWLSSVNIFPVSGLVLLMKKLPSPFLEHVQHRVGYSAWLFTGANTHSMQLKTVVDLFLSKGLTPGLAIQVDKLAPSNLGWKLLQTPRSLDPSELCHEIVISGEEMLDSQTCLSVSN